ncbi:alpha/beta fold hydrolase [Nocardioides sp. ChNu-153]|uniref:alpha/beta fold hydrolase n=1 Tax=Nocardioides sp. ChNu-153 TaxID=2779364 RepID=UPI00265AD1DD|nr:alpha/beta hydrolase [Nocardioides sp. ChNu-153]
MADGSHEGRAGRRALWALAAGATGAALAGAAAAGVAHRRKVIGRRGAGDEVELGSLRSPAVTVVADDGVALHVEVDEPEAAPAGVTGGVLPTVVFVHGYALDLDCWHFQRAAYRGQLRTVFYDQRSHGRSGRSSRENATIEQLGRDLRTVLDHVVPEGPVVLVGHSMGGMTVIALAEEHPEMFGDRVVGVGLVSTTAGGLDPSRVLVPVLPRTIGGQLAVRAVAALARGHRVVDGFRRAGRAVALVATERYAFGSEVPESYVRFVDRMLSRTSFEVLAEFFPAFGTLDKFAVVEALESVPTTIVCGTADKLTSIGHSRKLHAHIAGSRLLELDDAGHMVILERHERVNEALDELLEAASRG